MYRLGIKVQGFRARDSCGLLWGLMVWGVWGLGSRV